MYAIIHNFFSPQSVQETTIQTTHQKQYNMNVFQDKDISEQRERTKVTQDFMTKNSFPSFFRSRVNDACQIGLMESVLSEECQKFDQKYPENMEELIHNVTAWTGNVERKGEHGAWLKVLKDCRVIRLANDLEGDCIRKKIVDFVVELRKNMDDEYISNMKENMTSVESMNKRGLIRIGDKGCNITNDCRENETVVYVHFYADAISDSTKELIKKKWEVDDVFVHSNTLRYDEFSEVKIVLVKRFPSQVNTSEIYKRIVESSQWMYTMKEFSSSGEFVLCVKNDENVSVKSLIDSKNASECFKKGSGGDNSNKIRGSYTKNAVHFIALPSNNKKIKYARELGVRTVCYNCKKICENSSLMYGSGPHSHSYVCNKTLESSIQECFYKQYSCGFSRFIMNVFCIECLSKMNTLKVHGKCKHCLKPKDEFVHDEFIHISIHDGEVSGTCIDCICMKLPIQETIRGFLIGDTVRKVERILAAQITSKRIREDPDVLFDENLTSKEKKIRFEKAGIRSDWAMGSFD